MKSNYHKKIPFYNIIECTKKNPCVAALLQREGSSLLSLFYFLLFEIKHENQTIFTYCLSAFHHEKEKRLVFKFLFLNFKTKIKKTISIFNIYF